MPAQSDRLVRLREAADLGDIPYCSKSRIKKWVTCQEKFNFSYLKGVKTPETQPMRRGTTIHEAFEDYYANAAEYVRETDEFPAGVRLYQFLPDRGDWFDYTEPYISNFLVFENVRLQYCKTQPDLTVHDWLPVGVEAEEWLDDPLDYGEDAIPWMGYADVIFAAAAFPQVRDDDGVVIVDFKTGKTPQEKYRDDGIYLEGEYYAMLFESKWPVSAVAGYYPKNDDLIVSPLSESRRQKIRDVVHAMHAVNGKKPDSLEVDEQPLCKWGTGDDEECPFYDECASTWGEGLRNEDEFRSMVERNFSDNEIADHFGMEYGAVRYTKSKLGI